MPKKKLSSDLVWVWIVLAVSCTQGLYAIYYYGYVGQDFPEHSSKIANFDLGFSYFHTNPPGLYFLGSLFKKLSNTHFLEFTSVALLFINLIALFFLYRLLNWTLLLNPLRWACFLVVTFCPFRVVHSVVIAADALTLLPFLLLTFFAARLIAPPWNERAQVRTWMAISLLLSLSLYLKYTFVGLLPAFLFLLWHQLKFSAPSGKRSRITAVGLLSLAIPTLCFSHQMFLSKKAKSRTFEAHWRKGTQSSSMNFQDILLPKFHDIELFEAPDYWTKPLNRRHYFSYLPLVYATSVYDPLRFFQEPSDSWPTQPGKRIQAYRGRVMRSDIRFLSKVSILASFPIGLICLIGSMLMSFKHLKFLLWRKTTSDPRLVCANLFAIGFHLTILGPLPWIANAYEWGYFLPRLILPSLVVYIVLGFQWIAPRMKAKYTSIVLAYAIGLSALWMWIL